MDKFDKLESEFKKATYAFLDAEKYNLHLHIKYLQCKRALRQAGYCYHEVEDMIFEVISMRVDEELKSK